MYRVTVTSDVAAEVAAFTSATQRYWSVFLEEIAADPHPRYGQWVEQVIPIRGFPMRTHIFSITEDTSISGERIFLFAAEYLPECTPVYVIDEEAKVVEVFTLRPGFV